MKKNILIFITLLFFIPFFGTTSLLYAQRMAAEYDGGSLWKHAEATGRYIIMKCDYCDFVTCGTTDKELDDNMDAHKKDKHTYVYNAELEDKRNNSSMTGTNNNGENVSGEPNDIPGNNNLSNPSNSSRNLIDIVNVYCVAEAFEELGICSVEDFMEHYESSGNSYIIENYASTSTIDSFIYRYYKHILSQVSLSQAIKDSSPFIMFTKKGATEYYDKYLINKIYTNQYNAGLDITYCQLYVFNIKIVYGKYSE